MFITLCINLLIYIYKHNNYISLYLEDSSNILKMSAPKTANLIYLRLHSKKYN